MTSVYIAVRTLHVVLGSFWAGSILFSMLFLDPAVGEAGLEGGKIMGILQRRGWMTTALTTGALTVTSGFYLLWVMSGRFSPGFMGSRNGILLSVGMTAALVALTIGFFVSRPTARRIGAMWARVAASQGPPPADDLAELSGLRARMTVLLRVVGTLMLVALVTMALGAHS